MPGHFSESAEPFSEIALRSIFRVRVDDPSLIISREGNRLEFRETFSFAACRDKLRTFAAFANNQGGYLVFGVKDRPRTLLGLASTNFTELETEKITGLLNEHFAPEIAWEPWEYEFGGKLFGIIYIHETEQKPLICLKNSEQGKCRQGEIYYRYRGRSEQIRYPELRGILDAIRNRERDHWMKLLNKIASVGVRNAAVMDTVNGEVTGGAGSFMIDESLLPKLSFIREGDFTEVDGAPTLKVIGDVQVVDAGLVQPTREIVRRTSGINTPHIVHAFLDQEDVREPREYISAICFESASTLPVYYFASKAGLSAQDLLELVDNTMSTSASRRHLRRRIAESATSTAHIGTRLPSSQRDDEIREHILSQGLPESPSNEERRNYLHALMTLSAAEIEVSTLFPRLKTWFDSAYMQMDAGSRGAFRQVLVHLDNLLYRAQVDPS